MHIDWLICYIKKKDGKKWSKKQEHIRAVPRGDREEKYGKSENHIYSRSGAF